MPRKKRKALSGYPKTVFFDTRKALDDYRGGEKITCLLCGHKYTLLETHLRTQHDMTGDDYREKYGIPYTVGLCPEWRTERDSARMKNTLKNDKERVASQRLQLATNRKLHNTNAQRKKPEFWKNERTKHGKDIWFEFGRRVLSGRSQSDVASDDDMPHYAQIRWAKKRYPDFAKWWDAEVRPKMVNLRGWNLTHEGRQATNYYDTRQHNEPK